MTQQSSNFLLCSTRQKLRSSQGTESPFTLRVHLEHRQGQSREHESDCRAFGSATTEDAERDNRSKSAHTTSNTRALARTSSMSAADQPCTRPRSARLSRTEPKPPAAISLHAIPRTEARCTEFKRWNKETAAAGRTSLCSSSLGKHTQESASKADCNNALGPSRATSRQGIAQSPMRQAPESMSQKRWSEVNNESGAENSSRISVREQRSRSGEQLQDMGGW